MYIQMFIVTNSATLFWGFALFVLTFLVASGIKRCLFRLLKFQVDASNLHIFRAKLQQTYQEGRRGAEGPTKQTSLMMVIMLVWL